MSSNPIRPALSLVASSLALMLLGCGAPESPRDQHLTADEHEAAADREQTAGDEHAAMVNSTVVYYGPDAYNPSDAHVFEAQQHYQCAEEHRAIAVELRDFEEAECAEFPAETRASCPLLRGLERLEDIDGGVRMTFDANGDIQPVIDHLRCHIAFARASGEEGIELCSLYVPGSELRVDANVVDLVTDHPEFVDELRRRAAVQAPSDE